MRNMELTEKNGPEASSAKCEIAESASRGLEGNVHHGLGGIQAHRGERSYRGLDL